MKITKAQLKQIIKEELEEGIMDNFSGMFGSEESAKPIGRSAAAQQAENKLVNALLDYQEIFGDAHTAKSLRQMADDIEAGK